LLAGCNRLPERSRAGHPVKAFATLAAELGIRRETMDKLEVPKHYAPGGEFLRLSADIDKEGNGRPLWLSPRARAALKAVAPARGRIFSGFHYLKTFRTGARLVVGEERARHVTLRDLRHRCLTDIAEREGLAAAAYVGGHRSTEMAGRVYVSPQADSAEAALRARAREDRFQPGTEPGTGIELEPWAAILSQDLQRTRRDSNPRLLPPEGDHHRAELLYFPANSQKQDRPRRFESVQLSPGLGHGAPQWIRVLALEVLDDPSATIRETALARFLLSMLEERGNG